ncbi:MAG: hypothetical protein CMJ31_12190 [Phycisphaerae bacterium]|nr:hypothetical protein [Phycisphaerae bacterium]
MGVPDAAGETATLALMGPYTVSCAINPSIDALSITNSDAVIALQSGRTFTVGGPVLNDGLFIVNETSTSLTTSFRLGSDVLLSGTGALRLNGFATRARIITVDPSFTLTNSASHVIEGYGQCQTPFINSGLIEANANAQQLDVSFVGAGVNDGVMMASNGGSLLVRPTTLDQTGGGEIVSVDGVVELRSSAVSGGMLTQVGPDGVFNLTGNVSLDGVITAGDLVVPAGQVAVLAGPITNGGTITVNPSNVGVGTTFRAVGTSALNGSGTLRLGGSSTRAQFARLEGASVTNGASHTIAGFGRITAGPLNDGLVSADFAGQTLEISESDVVNNGTMNGSSGGELFLTGITVDQSGGGVIRTAGGSVDVLNTTIVGGLIEQNGADSFDLRSAAVLDGVTASGSIGVTAGNTIGLVGGMTNGGELIVNPTSVGVLTGVRIDESMTIDGAGTLRLNAFDSRAELSRADGSVTLTNGPSHAIRGVGRVSSGMVNQGVVSADIAGQTLQLRDGPVLNESELIAENGGQLVLSGIDVDQSGGGVIRTSGGTISINGARVTGGDLEQSGGDLLETLGGAVLEGVAISGSVEQVAGSTVSIVGGWTNNGVYTVNPNAVGVVTTLRVDSSSELSGDGVLRLAAFDSRASLARLDASVTVTNGVEHEIRGFGEVSSGLLNNGLVVADVAGQTFDVINSDVTNNAQMVASGGGTLEFEGVTVAQSIGGELVADGGEVLLNGATVVGGVLRRPDDTGVVRFNNATLEGVTIQDVAVLPGGSDVLVVGEIVNDGQIVVNETGIGVGTSLRFNSSASLRGSGEVVLNQTSVRAELVSEGEGVTLTNEEDHTVRGVGQIATPFLNEGTIEPGLGVGVMTATHPITFAPTGRFGLEVEGDGAPSADRLTSVASIELDGTLDVDFVDGFDPVAPIGFEILSSSVAISSRFDAIAGDAPAAPLVTRLYYSAGSVSIGFTCVADFGLPVGTLDIADVVAFLQLFGGADPSADLAAPFGQFDIGDVVAFLQAFGGGCP